MSYSSDQVSSIPSLFSSLSPPSNIIISSSHTRIFFFWQNSANSSSHSTTGLLLSPRLLASTSTDFPDSSLLNSQSLSHPCLETPKTSPTANFETHKTSPTADKTFPTPHTTSNNNLTQHICLPLSLFSTFRCSYNGSQPSLCHHSPIRKNIRLVELELNDCS